MECLTTLLFITFAGFDAEEAALDGEGDNEDEEGEEEMEDEEEDLDDGQLGCKAADGKLSEPMSAHERRMKRMAERAKVLEQRNIGDKEWFMQGETHAGAVPYFALHSHDRLYMVLWIAFVLNGGVHAHMCQKALPCAGVHINCIKSGQTFSIENATLLWVCFVTVDA